MNRAGLFTLGALVAILGCSEESVAICNGQVISNAALISAAKTDYVPQVGTNRALSCRSYGTLAEFDAANPDCCRVRKPGEIREPWELDLLPADTRPSRIVVRYECSAEVPFMVAELAMDDCARVLETIEGQTFGPEEER